MRNGTLESQYDVTAFIRHVCERRRATSDREVRGLQLEKSPSGQATWRLRISNPVDKRRHCITIGDASCLLLSDARRIALSLKRQLYLGEDFRRDRSPIKHGISFEEFVVKQYLPHTREYKKAWQSDLSLIKKHLLPVFGKKQIHQINRDDIAALYRDKVKSGAARGTANRVIAIARHIFNLAIQWETPLLEKNPTKDVRLVTEQTLERYLSQEDTERVFEAVIQSENKMLCYIVPMLILTGARKREVLDSKWEDFDLTNRVWRIPKTKSGVARYVPLSDGVLDLLATIPRFTGCAYVFPNPETLYPYQNIFTAWKVARARAKLPELRIHDLRHSFASFMVNNGRSLYEVQKILGHSQIKTTERYAHLSQETLIGAANTVSQVIGPSLGDLGRKKRVA